MEIWKPIPSAPGYEASSEGRVRRECNERILRLVWTATVQLYHNKKPKMLRVHELVAEAFYGPRPPGLVTRHLNDNPFDISVANLRYGTPKENSEDAVKNGRYKNRKGIFHSRAKLSNAQALAIPLLRKGGLTCTEIGKMFGVNRRTIQHVENGASWGHVQ